MHGSLNICVAAARPPSVLISVPTSETNPFLRRVTGMDEAMVPPGWPSNRRRCALDTPNVPHRPRTFSSLSLTNPLYLLAESAQGLFSQRLGSVPQSLGGYPYCRSLERKNHFGCLAASVAFSEFIIGRVSFRK